MEEERKSRLKKAGRDMRLLIPSHKKLFAGYTLFWVWRFFVFGHFEFSSQILPMAGIIPLAAYAIGFLLIGLLFRAHRETFEQKLFVQMAYPASIAILMTIGFILMTASRFLPDSSWATLIVFGIGGISVGLGTAEAHLEWGRLLISLGTRKALLFICPAFICAGLGSGLIYCIPWMAVQLIPMLLAPATLLYLHSHSEENANDAADPVDTPPFFIPWRFIITSILQGFAFGVAQAMPVSTNISNTEAIVTFSLIVCSLILLVFGSVFKMNFNRIIYQLGFPLMALGFAIIATPSIADSIGQFFLSTGCRLIVLIMWVLCIYLAKKHGLPSYWVFSLPTFAYFSGEALGLYAGITFLDFYEPNEGGIIALASIMTIFVLAGALAMLNESNMQNGWGPVRPSEEAPTETPEEATCQQIAKEYTLTPRETEVLLLLSKGYSRARIGEQLFLSKDTVKTHVGNIYSKLDIHSQQDVIKFIEKSMLE